MPILRCAHVLQCIRMLDATREVEEGPKLGFLNFGGHRLPPLFKCVVCQRRPGQTFHHHIPLCNSCATKLRRTIRRDGGAILRALDELRNADSPQLISQLKESIIGHAHELLSYEELNVKTIDPEPTVIIHLIRVDEYTNLFPRLAMD